MTTFDEALETELKKWVDARWAEAQRVLEEEFKKRGILVTRISIWLGAPEEGEARNE